MNHSAAFTLIELLIVIVVGIILAGTVLPAAHTLDDQSVSADARVLASDLEFVQARAIATGQNHRILFDVDNDRYQVESPPGVLLDEPLTKRPWVRKLGGPSDGVDVITADFDGAAAVLFDPAGAPDDGGMIVLEKGEFQATIRVQNVTGYVELFLP